MKQRKLEDRLFLMKPVGDGVDKFIPYCNYSRHQGIVTHNKYTNCERKNCHHYIRLYLTYEDLNSKKPNTWRDNIANCAKKYYDNFF